jgi:hypothetical protein
VSFSLFGRLVISVSVLLVTFILLLLFSKLSSSCLLNLVLEFELLFLRDFFFEDELFSFSLSFILIFSADFSYQSLSFFLSLSSLSLSFIGIFFDINLISELYKLSNYLSLSLSLS